MFAKLRTGQQMLALWVACVLPTAALATPSVEEQLKANIKNLQTKEREAKDEEAAALRKVFKTTISPEEKKLAALALAVYYWDTNERLATQYFGFASTLAQPDEAILNIIRYYRARSKISARLYQEGLADLKILLAVKNLDGKLAKNAQELRLDSLFTVEDLKTFLAEYEFYAARYQFHLQKGEIVKHAVLAYERSGKTNEYFSLLERLANLYPTTKQSEWAFGNLMRHSQSKEYTFKISFLSRINRFAAAVNADLKAQLHSLIESDEIQLEQGISKTLTPFEKISAYIRIREFEKALGITEQLFQSENLPSYTQGALIRLMAHLHARLNQNEEAEKLYNVYLSEHEKGTPSIMILEAQARALSKQGKYKEAAAIFNQIAEYNRNSYMTFERFWNLYLAGEDSQSLAMLERHDNLFSHDRSEAGANNYWHAKILMRKGQKAEATALLKEILEKHPEGYYAVLTLANYPQLREKDPISLDAMPADPLAQAQNGGILLADNSGDTIRYLNFSELLKMSTEVPGFFDRQIPNLSAWKASYPLAFDHVVTPVSKTVDLDKFLVLSIMRAESYYNETATSPVGARGLMQIMPYTAIRIAGLLKDENFEVENMVDPKINISYGAYYLKHLTTYYSDNFLLAVAAYNAGPDAVDDWVANCKGCGTDEFVESIPYKETRQYVKKVIRYYNQYRKIYENQGFLRIPEIPISPRLGMEVF